MQGRYIRVIKTLLEHTCPLRVTLHEDGLPTSLTDRERGEELTIFSAGYSLVSWGEEKTACIYTVYTMYIQL